MKTNEMSFYKTNEVGFAKTFTIVHLSKHLLQGVVLCAALGTALPGMAQPLQQSTGQATSPLAASGSSGQALPVDPAARRSRPAPPGTNLYVFSGDDG